MVVVARGTSWASVLQARDYTGRMPVRMGPRGPTQEDRLFMSPKESAEGPQSSVRTGEECGHVPPAESRIGFPCCILPWPEQCTLPQAPCFLSLHGPCAGKGRCWDFHAAGTNTDSAWRGFLEWPGGHSLSWGEPGLDSTQPKPPDEPLSKEGCTPGVALF